MGPSLGDIRARVRFLAAEPSTTRFTDVNLTNCINQALRQIALEQEFPESTFSFSTIIPPQPPTLTTHGTPGTTQYTYALVQMAALPTTGDSAPSPQVVLQTGNAVLSATNYNVATFASVAGTGYKLIRWTAASPQPHLVAIVTATGATTTVNDQGALPQPYTVVKGNEYGVPEMIKILRAYIVTPGGSYQELVGTDIWRLEGDALQEYDNTSGTQFGLPTQTPQWMASLSQSYPVQTTQVGGRVPALLPYQPVGQRPMYYMRAAGVLGIVPQPAVPVIVQCDCIPMPADLVRASDRCNFPFEWIDGICWKTLKYVHYSDESDMMLADENMYQEEMRKYRRQTANMQATKPKQDSVLTRRGAGMYGGRGGSW